jgi:hypothetical protein
VCISETAIKIFQKLGSDNYKAEKGKEAILFLTSTLG